MAEQQSSDAPVAKAPLNESGAILPGASSFSFRFTLRRLFRVQLGIAGLLGVAAFAYRIPQHVAWPDPYLQDLGIVESTTTSFPYLRFSVLTSIAAIAGYSVARFAFKQFSRVTAVLCAMLSAQVMALSFALDAFGFYRAAIALLGMGVALSWYVAVGWLDPRGRVAESRRSDGPAVM